MKHYFFIISTASLFLLSTAQAQFFFKKKPPLVLKNNEQSIDIERGTMIKVVRVDGKIIQGGAVVGRFMSLNNNDGTITIDRIPLPTKIRIDEIKKIYISNEGFSFIKAIGCGSLATLVWGVPWIIMYENASLDKMVFPGAMLLITPAATISGFFGGGIYFPSEWQEPMLINENEWKILY